jgi:Phospholipase_D-nuclease N-terminal
VTRPPRAQRAAEHLIARACRRLPGEAGDERYREWAAELPAILDDPDTRSGVLRSARALRYAAGICRCTRGPYLSARRARRPARSGAGALLRRVLAGLGIYFLVAAPIVALAAVSHRHGPWLIVWLTAAAGAFAVFCLVDLARADQVRYLPKWAWTIACLIQIPFGGIMYLTVGRVRRDTEQS